MYNPFSLLNAFKRKEFGSYWFETGTPTYLVKLLKKHHYDLERMAHEETDVQVLNSIDSESTTLKILKKPSLDVLEEYELMADKGGK